MIKIVIVGATGLVGRKILNVLNERGFAKEKILAVASQKSIGKQIEFAGRILSVISVEEAIEENCDYAIFSAGSTASKKYAPLFAERGTIVIDNSSAWRMNSNVPLVVPEINGSDITSDTCIIANPNCSTIQMVMALCPLYKRYGIRRIVVSTYQSVTGTGINAVHQLENEESSIENYEMVYPYKIHRNLFPHGGDFLPNGYTTEEEKLVNETRKVFGNQQIQVSATVVRVPVTGGHSESVNVEFENDFTMNEVYSLLNGFKGVVLIDNTSENQYPMPLHSEGKDEVFVGRLRRDFTQPNTLNLWVVSDNLRKGSATNAVQILEYLLSR
jgi:aspartate-semialdehyde dehydrogenase